MSNALCIENSLFETAEGKQECGSCYMVNMETVIGIIVSDIILTILIATSVFCFVSHQRRTRECQSQKGERNKPPSTSNKVSPQDNESPYQELHGVQSDVYSELQHFRK